MPGLDELKNTAEGALGAAKEAADAMKQKAEDLSGIDIDGDGMVGTTGQAGEGDNLQAKASEAFAAAKEAVVDAVDAAKSAAVAATAAVDAQPTEETMAASAEVPASAKGTFDAQEDLLTPVIDKAAEVAGNAVNTLEGMTGVDINGDGVVGSDAPVAEAPAAEAAVEAEAEAPAEEA